MFKIVKDLGDCNVTMTHLPVLITKCFVHHSFYTVLWGKTIIWGFIHDDDKFQITQVQPHTWESYKAYDRHYSNFRIMKSDTHAIAHANFIAELFNSYTFCPSFLRKHRIPPKETVSL